MHGLQACLFEYITVAAFRIYLSVVKIPLKGEVEGHALISHGNNIVDHGIVFMNICGKPICGKPVKCAFLNWYKLVI